MLEQRRLDYLNSMGIVQWLPRQPLPHAPAPRWLPTEAAVAVVDVAANQSQHSAPALAATLAPAAKTAVAALLSGGTTESAPEFRLFFIGCELPVVWVCADPNEVEALQRLVFAAQKALLGQAYFIPQAQEFRWPYLNSKQHDQSQAVAVQALTAQWQVLNQHAKQPLQAICFGSVSQHWLTEINVPCLFSAPTLADCLTQAPLKRALWLQLLSTQTPLPNS